MPLRSKDKRSFKSSLKDCFNGLEFIIVNEDNFKREIVLGIIALVLCYILKVSKIEFIAIIIVIALVLVSEVFNTAIEKTVDLYTKEYNKTAKVAKDVSAFAVLLVSFFSLVVGVIIFGSRILTLIGGK